jgi:hypothetical protein
MATWCAGRRADCCAWGAGLLLPGSSLSGGGGLPLSASLGRSWPDFLAWSVAAAWHIATSSPSGGHRLRSFAGWLLLAQLFYVRRRGAAPLRIPGRQLLACFALRSLAAADAPWPTVGGAPRLGWPHVFGPLVRWLGLAWVLCTLWRVLSVWGSAPCSRGQCLHLHQHLQSSSA